MVVTLQLDGQYQPPIAVSIANRGLAVHQFILQHDGKTHDIVVGPQLAADFDKPGHKYQNVIIGRYSNRVPTGTHSLAKDGAESTFTSLANEHEKVSLHGGPSGLDTVEWESIKVADATLFSPKERAQLEAFPPDSAALFRYTSPDGDSGFPGVLHLEVLFALVPSSDKPAVEAKEVALGSLVIVYRAKVDEKEGKKVVTPVNLTQHWGFNLDASLLSPARQPMTDIKEHVLTINADHHVELDSLALATGELLPTANTPEHAHAAKPVGELFPASGYDSFYVFRSSLPSKIPIHVPLASLETFDALSDILKPYGLEQEAEAEPLVTLTSPKSGITVHFGSNQPGVQFYSGNFMDGKGSRKRIHGGTGVLGEGDGYPAVSAAFLEFHELLAAWLHPYGSGENKAKDTLLTSDELYNNFVKVDVVAKVLDESSA
ncbi:galactose mutarotase-like protein [Exidia glandulosa HHB12029]|uniref:Galactose mutarotase-like protein n=1 Tax=Exidia glandulosa HHB12029 TaxID=1314781 RepID=A0A165JE48_EXIGL|nr:galactose mutarotase-like protein [Exidia glandulosa HHB12029]